MTHATTVKACVQDLRQSADLVVSTNVVMARRTTIRIGGAADIWVDASGPEAVRHCLEVASAFEMPVHIVGKGSNLLVADEGVRGIIVALRDSSNGAVFGEGEVRVDGAYPLGRLVMDSAERGYRNLVHLAGIPGTVGGALAMNAGTARHFIDSEVLSVSALSLQKPFDVHTMIHDDVSWGYRSTSLRDHFVILGAVLRVGQLASPSSVIAEVAESIGLRKMKQPLKLPNAGSVFRNPEGDFAGRLIELVGLKGKRIGDVQFAEQHANFIVNCGGGRATDVVKLIELAKERVYSQYGIRLQTEIRPLGEISF